MHGVSDCDCCCRSSAASQSLDELDFARGIWSAALDGDIEKVKSLLDKNVDPSQKDGYGYTALHYAARNGHKAVCELLLKRGGDPNSTNCGGATPLHRAAYMGHSEVISLLLKYKADPFVSDSDGKNPLHKAAEGSHYTAAEVLLRVCPELKKQTDKADRTPVACVSSEDERLKNLLS